MCHRSQLLAVGGDNCGEGRHLTVVAPSSIHLRVHIFPSKHSHTRLKAWVVVTPFIRTWLVAHPGTWVMHSAALIEPRWKKLVLMVLMCLLTSLLNLHLNLSRVMGRQRGAHMGCRIRDRTMFPQRWITLHCAHLLRFRLTHTRSNIVLWTGEKVWQIKHWCSIYRWLKARFWCVLWRKLSFHLQDIADFLRYWSMFVTDPVLTPLM